MGLIHNKGAIKPGILSNFGNATTYNIATLWYGKFQNSICPCSKCIIDSTCGIFNGIHLETARSMVLMILAPAMRSGSATSQLAMNVETP